jgi:hypothetical protein
MNLMERKNRKENNNPEQLEDGHSSKAEDDLEIVDLNEPDEDEAEAGGGLHELLQKPYMTTVLMGIIVLLLVCIIVLLVVMPSRRDSRQASSDTDLQQNITDYANEQIEKEKDADQDKLSDAIVVTLPAQDAAKEDTQEAEEAEEEEEEEPETTEKPEAADSDKTAVVVDIEDENDEAYTKEFILNEALPYFADNKQDAIWDLAHLKRYVKLSQELEGSGKFYYQGDVDGDGRPNGKGLAIYEKNSYYYGEWSHGVRSGTGNWFKFYIGQRNKTNAMGKYMAHSYSGSWANDLPNGEGAEHYDVDISKLEANTRILQNVVGHFTDGLYDGDMYANSVDYVGNVEEWNGVCEKGVFTLWRDMSAIGECSVWQNRDDSSLCMDIDKSENKNQGIRELLK